MAPVALEYRLKKVEAQLPRLSMSLPRPLPLASSQYHRGASRRWAEVVCVESKSRGRKKEQVEAEREMGADVRTAVCRARLMITHVGKSNPMATVNWDIFFSHTDAHMMMIPP